MHANVTGLHVSRCRRLAAVGHAHRRRRPRKYIGCHGSSGRRRRCAGVRLRGDDALLSVGAVVRRVALRPCQTWQHVGRHLYMFNKTHFKSRAQVLFVLLRFVTEPCYSSAGLVRANGTCRPCPLRILSWRPNWIFYNTPTATCLQLEVELLIFASRHGAFPPT